MFILLLVLRLLHISAGVFWAGVAVYNAFFVLPAATALGPDGGKFMRQLSVTNQFSNVLTTVSTITVLTGIILISILSGGFSASWFLTLHGSILLFGASSALTAYGIGFAVNRPTVAKIARLNGQIVKQGGPPTDEQKLLMRQYSSTLAKFTTLIAFFLIIAVAGMSVVRYF